jgi:hypothetical protein
MKMTHPARVAWHRRNVRKIQTSGYFGSQKRVTVTGTRMTHHARVAWRRENVRKDQTKKQAERGTPK